MKEPAPAATAASQPPTTAPEAPARGVGLVAYASDSDDDDQESSDSSSEDEAINVAPSAPTDSDVRPAQPVRNQTEQQRTPEGRIICRYYAKNGRCNNGRKCRFAHVVSQIVICTWSPLKCFLIASDSAKETLVKRKRQEISRNLSPRSSGQVCLDSCLTNPSHKPYHSSLKRSTSSCPMTFSTMSSSVLARRKKWSG